MAELDRQAVIEGFNDTGINPKEAVLIGGAAMVLQGIKPHTSDLDVLVSLCEERRLRSEAGWSIDSKEYDIHDALHRQIGTIPVTAAFAFDDVLSVSYNSAFRQSIDLSGIRVLEALALRQWKRDLYRVRKRPKDGVDLMALEAFLMGRND